MKELPGYRYFRTYLEEADNERCVTLFCKSLYLFLILKIIFLWPLLDEVERYLPFEFTTLRYVVFAPVKLAQWNLNAFLIGFLVVLLVALKRRINPFTSALIFWLSASLSRLTGPMANGSDYIINLFLMLSIAHSYRPLFNTPASMPMQRIVSNFAFLFCQIQVALIYLLSGYNKMTSPEWRSGEAVHSILNLDYFINPLWEYPFHAGAYRAIAWGIILFELGFPFLIGFRKLRVPLLAIGVLFHLGIAYFLTLPDFGLVMILTYWLFIPTTLLYRPRCV